MEGIVEKRNHREFGAWGTKGAVAQLDGWKLQELELVVVGGKMVAMGSAAGSVLPC